uniref:Tctex1 domain containing 1 n=1 Tax=Calidris pygmaea TaxID=425635 RepID=A0A8C3PT68_9CHAR
MAACAGATASGWAGRRRPAPPRGRREPEPAGRCRPPPSRPSASPQQRCRGCTAAPSAATPARVGARAGSFGAGRGAFLRLQRGGFFPSKNPAEPHSAGPPKRFPVAAVDDILKDVVGSYLREQPYEPARCRDMAKDMAEVIKARVKDLMVPRYKIVVVTHIGQLNEQGMQIGSRCLWDPASDTFSSYMFKNTSLFALANVYAVYFE